MRACSLVLLFHLLPPSLPADVYVGPDPATALFRRDRIPIDTDTMRELSRHLTDLARREMAQEPVQLRATAQLLAIAVRLDPANRPARGQGENFLSISKTFIRADSGEKIV